MNETMTISVNGNVKREIGMALRFKPVIKIDDKVE